MDRFFVDARGENFANTNSFLPSLYSRRSTTQGSADHSVRAAQPVKILSFNGIKYTQHLLYALGVFLKKWAKIKKVVNNKTSSVL
jgi:hypothetical protein